MTLLVRDELDIISDTLAYHLSMGIDHILVTDNLSQDGTSDVLRDYERLGSVTVYQERDDIYDQSAWVTRMARRAATEFGADWVINSDADEFWWPLDLKERLAGLPVSVGRVAVPRTNFLPVRNPSGPFWESMVLRERQSRNAAGRPLPGKVVHRADPTVVVKQGNHGVIAAALGEEHVDPAVIIMHFPIRSFYQLRNKISKGGAAYERNPHAPPAMGRTWRYLWALEQAGELRAWYDAQLHAEDALDSDEILQDTRVRDTMRTLLQEKAP